MPSIDFEVFCEMCGAGLCRNTSVNGTSIYVSPCRNCMDSEADDAAEKAYSAGFVDGEASVR